MQVFLEFGFEAVGCLRRRQSVDDINGSGEEGGMSAEAAFIVFPKPTPPMKMTLPLSLRKERRKRFCTWGRLIFLGQVQLNCSRVLMMGKRALAMRRWVARSLRRKVSPSASRLKKSNCVQFFSTASLASERWCSLK